MATIACLLATGCGSGTETSKAGGGTRTVYTGNKGGSPAATSAANTAGTLATGGATTAPVTTSAAGGATATAGVTAVAGATATAGATAVAGATATAGTTLVAGSTLVGGNTASGGTPAAAGTTASSTTSLPRDAGVPDVVQDRMDVGTDAPVPDAPDAATDAAPRTDIPVGEAGVTGACGTPNWNRSFSIANFSGAAVDDKNLVVAAKGFSPLEFGTGPLAWAEGADIALVKYDATGQPLWAKVYGDLDDQIPGRIATAKSGAIGMFGTYVGSLTIKNTVTNTGSEFLDFLAGFDADGTARWIKSINTKGGAFAAIASHPSQSAFAVCGYALGATTDLVSGATAGGDGLEDILLAKIDAATGDVLWSRQIGGVGMQTCQALAMDAAGDVFAAGNYNRTLDLGNGPLSLVPVQASRAIWVGKFDGSTGAAKAGNGWDNGLKNSLRDLALDGTGNIAIVGAFRGTMTVGSLSMSTVVSKTASDAGVRVNDTTDVFVIKLDGTLNPQWLRSWGDASGRSQEVRTAVFVSGNDLLIAGKLNGTVELGDGQVPLVSATGADFYLKPVEDVFMIKLRGASGAVLCSGRYGDQYPQSPSFLVTNPVVTENTISMVGEFQSFIDFGLGPMTATAGGSGTQRQSFVVQFTP